MKVFLKIISNANINKVLKFWTSFNLHSFDPQFCQTAVSCNEACPHFVRLL